ncbi:MAG: hypothetical protein EBS90_11570 [Betaproteobacteria bacterium]|nr:hypothetical protein [Betaproteobacteria bacterium]
MHPKDIRVLRVSCDESGSGVFRVHLTEGDWEALCQEWDRLVQTNESLQKSFDAPDGGPLARALARSMYHSEQQEKRKLHLALRRVLAALKNGSGATADASVEFMCRTPDEVEAVIDHYRSVVDSLEKGIEAQDYVLTNRFNEQLARANEATAELKLIEKANEGELPRDALALQNAALTARVRKLESMLVTLGGAAATRRMEER